MPCYRTPAQVRTMRMEDKENASPQLAATPVPAAKGLAGATTDNIASALGAKNRFGYTPSPVQQVLPKAQAFTLDFAPKSKPAAATASAPSAKTLIKELGGGVAATLAPDCAHDAQPAPSAKQLLTELQEQSASGSSPTPSDSAGAETDAFTVIFTPQKLAKKPVLAARKPALEKKPAMAVHKPALEKKPALAAKKPTLEKKPAPAPKTTASLASKFPGVRKSQELAGVPRNTIGSKMVASSAAERKAVAIRPGVGKAAEKKALETKRVAVQGAGPKTARASLAGMPVQKAVVKRAAVKKRQTFHDKWADDDVFAEADSTKTPLHEKLDRIRIEHGCSLGEARRLMWKETWDPLSKTSDQNDDGDVCVQPTRPVDPIADQFGDDTAPPDVKQRPSSAPNSPNRASTGMAPLERAKSSDYSGAEGKKGEDVFADEFVVMNTPSKFPVFAATPGKDIRRHSLLYSPSFAKIKGGYGSRTPADMIKRATGGTAPVCVSPLAELDTSQTLGDVGTPVASRDSRELTASPIGMASPGVEEDADDSFQSASDSPKGTPRALMLNAGRQASLSPLPGDRLSFSAYSHRSETAEMATSPFPDKMAAPASRRSSKEVTLHTDIITKEVERVVERIVHVEVPGPERIVEVIKEVPVDRIVVREVPVYVDRIVESDRLVTTVKEVPIDRIIKSEVAVSVDKIVMHEIEVEKIVEVIKEVEVEKIVEVESAAMRKELETCTQQREELREQRQELEQQRHELQKQYQDTRELLSAKGYEMSALKEELGALQQQREHAAAEAASALSDMTLSLGNKSGECAELAAAVTGADARVEALQAKIDASKDAERLLETKLTSAEEAMKNLETRCTSAAEALATKKAEKAELELRYCGSVQQLAETEQALKTEGEAKSQLEARYNATITDFQDQLQRAAELESEMRELSGVKQTMEDQMEHLKSSVAERTAAAAQLHAQLDAATTSAAADTAIKDELQHKLTAAEGQLEEVSSRMAALQENFTSLTEQLAELTRCLDTIKSEKEGIVVENIAVQQADEHKAALILDLNAEVSDLSANMAEATAQLKSLTEEKEKVGDILERQSEELKNLLQRLEEAEKIGEAAAAKEELLLSKVTAAEEALEDKEAAEKALLMRVKEAEAECEQAVEEVGKLKDRLRLAQENVDALTAQNTDVTGAVEEAYTEVRSLAQQLLEREASVEAMQLEMQEALKAQLLAAQEELKTCNETLAEAQARLSEALADAAQAQAESTATRRATEDLAGNVRDKELVISKLEDELKKKGSEIIYQEVVREVEVSVVREVEVERIVEVEVEVERIVTEIEYRDVEVIKEIEVEKIVTEIEYRDVEVVKEIEVEKIVTEIEYRDVEVIKEIEVEKIVTQIEYRDVEVVKEIEVEKIVTEIEYREVEVVKEIEVEKIVTAIEYRDVEVVKEIEVEKIVTEIEYRDVEVIKEIEVEKIVFKSPVKQLMVNPHSKFKKSAPDSAAPLTATTVHASRGRTYAASVCAVIALCVAVCVVSIPLYDFARGTCPGVDWALGPLKRGHPLTAANFMSGDRALTHSLKDATAKLHDLQGEALRRNTQLNNALAANQKALVGKQSAEDAAAAASDASAGMAKLLQAEADKASEAALLVAAMHKEMAEIKAKEQDMMQQLDMLRKTAEQQLASQSAKAHEVTAKNKVDRVRALKQFGAFAGSLW